MVQRRVDFQELNIDLQPEEVKEGLCRLASGSLKTQCCLKSLIKVSSNQREADFQFFFFFGLASSPSEHSSQTTLNARAHTGENDREDD